MKVYPKAFTSPTASIMTMNYRIRIAMVIVLVIVFPRYLLKVHIHDLEEEYRAHRQVNGWIDSGLSTRYPETQFKVAAGLPF